MYQSNTTKILKLFGQIALVGSLLISTPSFAATTTELENGDSLTLYGIGVHQEKRNDIYLGLLFAPEGTDSISDIKDNLLSKRMSLKFLSKYSNRKMSRMWKQRIAMNNNKEDWRPLTKHIVNFAGLFKRSMQAGDQINIDFYPNIGTKIFLNETLFLTVSEPEFFNLLLNIWVGSVPPTQLFKNGISGQNSESETDKLFSRYTSIQSEIGRFDDDLPNDTAKIAKTTTAAKNTDKKPTQTKKQVVASKPADKPEKSEVAASNKSKSQLEAEKLSATLKSDITRTKTEVAKTKTSKDEKELFKTDLGVDKSNLVIAASQSASKLPELSQPANTKQEQPKQNAAKETASKKQVKSVTKVAKREQPEEIFDADLLSGSYTQELINTIRKFQSYPKKALKEGAEGDVTIMVTIDKAGELLDYEYTQRAKSRILNREVLRIIKRAVPFPRIPAELKLQKFEFEVPMHFSLGDGS